MAVFRIERTRDYERMMMQVPRSPRPVHPPQAPKGHPCHSCKRYGEGCALPCYRGITYAYPVS